MEGRARWEDEGYHQGSEAVFVLYFGWQGHISQLQLWELCHQDGGGILGKEPDSRKWWKNSGHQDLVEDYKGSLVID